MSETNRSEGKAALTLEITTTNVLLAGEGDLGDPVAQHLTDLGVGDIAHLVVLLDHLTASIAHAPVARLCEGIANIVACANVAVDASPARITLAFLLVTAERSIRATGERATNCTRLSVLGTRACSDREGSGKRTRFEAVLAAKSGGAVAFAAVLVAWRELAA